MLISSYNDSGRGKPLPYGRSGIPRWRRSAAVEISLYRRALREAPLRVVRSVGAWVQQLKFGCTARADDIRPYVGRGAEASEIMRAAGACFAGRRGRRPLQF